MVDNLADAYIGAGELFPMRDVPEGFTGATLGPAAVATTLEGPSGGTAHMCSPT